MKRLQRTVLLCLWVLSSLAAPPKQTALDRYIAASDPSFNWELVNTVEGAGETTFVLDLTSQTWRSASEVDRPLWKHWLTIIRPKQVRHKTGLLFITGGSASTKLPAQADPMLRSIAIDSQSIVAELRMVPNQPITFHGEGKGRTEDSLIAYTWDKYLRGGDEVWPARLPMTRSAVRAMDAVTQFCATEKAGGVKVSEFVVSGASKRGWTTWTTAATDKRVVAIIPLVIDMLNIEPSFQHHYQVYGFWAPAIRDYVDMKIVDWTGDPRYRELMKIEEPYEYRDRLTMPKFMINATGDQFFLPDSWQFYWNELKGEKYIRYVPNADHSLRRSDAPDSLHAFYEAILEGKERPRFDWKIGRDGTIRVKTSSKNGEGPAEVRLWQATNPEARDFRLEKIGPAWKDTLLQPKKAGEYEARVQSPPRGFTAYMVEATWNQSKGHPLKFTTGVKVIPDTLPFPPYRPKRPN